MYLYKVQYRLLLSAKCVQLAAHWPHRPCAAKHSQEYSSRQKSHMYLKHYAVCDYIYISVEWLSELAFCRWQCCAAMTKGDMVAVKHPLLRLDCSFPRCVCYSHEPGSTLLGDVCHSSERRQDSHSSHPCPVAHSWTKHIVSLSSLFLKHSSLQTHGCLARVFNSRKWDPDRVHQKIIILTATLYNQPVTW